MKKIKNIILLILFNLFINSISISQEYKYLKDESANSLPFLFPLYDSPFNSYKGYSFPSMYQSLNLSKNVAQIAHAYLLDFTFDIKLNNFFAFLTLAVFDYFYTYLPPGYAWVHEEWHRAVMTRRGMGSYNDVYKFDLFTDSISVSHIKDADLVKLKKKFPHDLIRLSEAGYEGDIELAVQMRRDSFFYGRSVRYDLITWWLNILNDVLYIDLCTSREADRETDKMNREDGVNIHKRDFVGLDFTSWVYDLFRPNEPYSARGIHPSGVGYDRYIKYSDLDDNEKRYIKRQRNLSLLNFISPQMVGINRFMISGESEKLYYNFFVIHQLTSFGYTIDTLFLISRRELNLCIVYHQYANYSGYFPGIEFSLVRYPLNINKLDFKLSSTAYLWLQPEGQKFRTPNGSPGGLLKLGLFFPIDKNFEFFIQTEAKTEGWVSGVVSLEKAIGLLTGIILII